MTISDINTLCRFLCDADTNSYTAANLLITINQAYEEVVGKILDNDGTWQFDDSNYTSFPRGYKNLVDGQYDYSFDETFLKVEEVHILDSNGDYKKLKPIDPRDYSEPLTEVFNVNGEPEYYDKDGGSILVYPAPDSGNVTLTNGLRVHFRRTADKFTSAQVTTGTKEPGFASPWHAILAYKAAIPFCMKYRKDRFAPLELKVAQMEKELLEHYAKREDDVTPRFSMAGHNPR